MEMPPPRGLGWLLLGLRGVAILLITAILFPLWWLAWLLDKPFNSTWRQHVVSLWGRLLLWCCGVSLEVIGTPMRQAGAVVANHASWMDILALHAVHKVYFVSKAEVGAWPGIGFLAQMTNTIFIERKRSEILLQQSLLRSRIARGDRICFFPEGTSTDSIRVLRFKPALFSTFYDEETSAGIVSGNWHVQPVTLDYLPISGVDRRYLGWWGDMVLHEHIFSVVSRWRFSKLRVVMHKPVSVAQFDGRAALANYCENQVRQGLSYRE